MDLTSSPFGIVPLYLFVFILRLPNVLFSVLFYFITFLLIPSRNSFLTNKEVEKYNDSLYYMKQTEFINGSIIWLGNELNV